MKTRWLCGTLLLGVALPAFALELPRGKDPSPPAAPDFSREPFVIEVLKSSLRFEADGTGTKTVQTRVLVQTEGALQQLGQLVLDYNSDFERLTFKGRVIKPDGTKAEPLVRVSGYAGFGYYGGFVSLAKLDWQHLELRAKRNPQEIEELNSLDHLELCSWEGIYVNCREACCYWFGGNDELQNLHRGGRLVESFFAEHPEQAHIRLRLAFRAKQQILQVVAVQRARQEILAIDVRQPCLGKTQKLQWIARIGR